MYLSWKKNRTLKHVHCGLKCSEKLHKANAKTTLTLLTTQRKHALSKGERLQLSGFQQCNTDNLSLQWHGQSSKENKFTVTSLHCLCHKLASKYYNRFHQKLAMGGLCQMTSFVARGNIRGSIQVACVQDNQILLLRFSATA